MNIPELIKICDEAIDDLRSDKSEYEQKKYQFFMTTFNPSFVKQLLLEKLSDQLKVKDYEEALGDIKNNGNCFSYCDGTATAVLKKHGVIE